MKQIHFKILKYLIAIISIFTAIYFKSTDFLGGNINEKLASEFLYDLSVNIFASMILVFFIDEVRAQIDNKNRTINTKTKIINFINSTEILLQKYTRYFYFVTTPIEKRDYKSIFILKEIYIFDLCDLHSPSLLVTDSYSKSSISYFFEVEKELLQTFENALLNLDFQDFKKLESILINFISLYNKVNIRDVITENEKNSFEKDKMSTYIKRLIMEHGEEFYSKYKVGEYSLSNIFTPYIALYQLLNDEKEIINQFIIEGNLIRNDNK